MICSTLSGMIAIKHPTLGVLVREDGMVFNSIRGGHGKKYAYTKGYLQREGYRAIKIQGKLYLVHRLLAEAFLSNTDNKPTIDHINRIREDNRISNLRWATYKEQAENRMSVRKFENKSEYNREYKRAHRDEILAKQREYRNAHRYERREYLRKYRERKKLQYSQCN